jgi:hypothetical protein
MCNIIANRFDLFNYNESIYAHLPPNYSKKDNIHFLKTENQYVTKLFASYFYDNQYIELETFDWGMFDYIFITERKNIIDQMASLYTIRYNNKCVDTYINLSNEKVIKMYNLHQEYMKLFYKIKNNLLCNYKNVYVVEYEKMQENMLKYLNDITDISFADEHIPKTKPEQVNYSKQYTNYNDLKAIVDSWDIPTLWGLTNETE